MAKLTIWIVDRALASAVTGPLDVLTVANSIWAHRTKAKSRALFEWRIESVGGTHVRTASGIPLNVDGPIDPDARTDVLLLAGIYADAGLEQLVKTLFRLQPLLPALRKLHERGTLLAANCTSTFLLAEAGLLDHRPATTSWWLAQAFRQRYPAVDLRPGEVLTEKDRLICSGAVTAYLNLALRLVEKFGGASLARSTARTMLIDTNRLSQAAYRILSVEGQSSHSDEVVSQAQRRIEKRLQEPFSLPDLARDLSVSERTLIRRFNKALGQTPLAYLQSQRIETAKHLLETSALTVDAVCEHIGYADVSSFRRLFRRETGLSPREFQRALGRRALVVRNENAVAGRRA
jgi:transcriptional regulator GlxA family with amidase domain